MCYLLSSCRHLSSASPLNVSSTVVTGGAERSLRTSTSPSSSSSSMYSRTVFHRNPSSSAILDIGLGSSATHCIMASARLSVSAILPINVPFSIMGYGLSVDSMLQRLDVETLSLNISMFKRLNGDICARPGGRVA